MSSEKLGFKAEGLRLRYLQTGDHADAQKWLEVREQEKKRSWVDKMEQTPPELKFDKVSIIGMGFLGAIVAVALLTNKGRKL